MKDLEEDFNCPVCLEQLTPPVLQCKEGHNLCTKCKKEDLHQCPLCQEPFVETTNRLLDKILTLLPKPCPYADKGCPFIVSDDHQAKWCRFRTILCPYCRFSGHSVSDRLSSHVKQNHEDRGYLLLNEPMTMELANLQSGCAFTLNTNYYFFYRQYCSRNNVHKLFVKYILIKQTIDDFYFQIVFKDKLTDKTLHSLIMKPSFVVEDDKRYEYFDDDDDDADDTYMLTFKWDYPAPNTIVTITPITM